MTLRERLASAASAEGGIIFTLGFIAGFPHYFYADLGWQLAEGRALWGGSFPTRLPEAIAAGPWIDHEWLFEALAWPFWAHAAWPVFAALCTALVATVPLLAPAIRQFRLTHQQTQVEVITAQQAEIRLGILEGSLDLGLVNYLDGDDHPVEVRVQCTAGHEVAPVGDGALQVRGDSMIEAGILDGDMALIQRNETAETGDIVVALIDEEEATLKRFRRRGASIALEPANTSYEVRILPPNRVKIQGKLIGLYRKY